MKKLPRLNTKMRGVLRGSASRASSKFSVGGRRKEGLYAPKPVTLRRAELERPNG
ncbi:MAG TPA: hypothetical protein VGG48_14225 [Rhizomicrobium sp.]|jgi:hypothetical protein